MPETPATRRVYDAQKILAGEQNAKIIREWEIFVIFCQSVKLDIEPGGIEMLDPNSSSPPPPDLRCRLDGEHHYVELGEIVQEDLVRAVAPGARKLIRDSIPITKVLTPLETMIEKKLSKSYCPTARPLSLLLYYDRGAPFWEQLQPLVREREEAILALTEGSSFQSIWLFDARRRKVLATFSASAVNIAE